MYKYICNEEKQSSLIHLTYFVYLFFVCCVCLFVCCVCFLLHLLVSLLCFFCCICLTMRNVKEALAHCRARSVYILPLSLSHCLHPLSYAANAIFCFSLFLPPASSCQRCCCVPSYQMNFFMWFLCICT